MRKLKLTKGFTLVELIISIAVFTMVIWTVSIFQKDVFFLNNNLQSSLNAQLEARHLIKTMVSELRRTAQPSTGAYPIELASSTGITFYSDINNDGNIDKVRYYLNGKGITKGVTPPTGSPITYNSVNEVKSTIINYIKASTTLPIFQYYTASYSGTTSPLTIPVDITAIRLIKTTLIIDTDPNRSPVPIIATSNVTLRNLKDNL